MHSARIWSAALLGRAAILLGAGPGYFVDRGSYEAGMNAERDADKMTQRRFGVQTVTELEIRATDRVAFFGGVRSEMRARHLSSVIVYPTAGVRVGF